MNKAIGIGLIILIALQAWLLAALYWPAHAPAPTPTVTATVSPTATATATPMPTATPTPAINTLFPLYPGSVLLGNTFYPFLYFDTSIIDIIENVVRILAIPVPYYWEMHEYPVGTTFGHVMAYYNDLLLNNGFKLVHNEQFDSNMYLIKYRSGDGRLVAVMINTEMPTQDLMIVWGKWFFPPGLGA